QAFLRFAGIADRLSYYDWYGALIRYFSEAEKARVIDFAWDGIFSSKASGILPQLCAEKPDCYPCPLKNNCQLYNRHFSKISEKNTIEKLAVGKENELETDDLIEFLLKSSFGDTELQKELIATFPKESKQPFFDIKRSHLDQNFYSRYQALLALCRKFHSTDTLEVGASFTSSSQVFEHFRYSLARQKQESFYIVLLDQAFKIIRLDEITRGTLDESLVHPREVFAQAIQLRASSLILIHNHPAGTLQPSPEDRQVTSRLIEAGKIIGIKVLDHIIVSENGYFSFDEKGILTELKN
ncbi:MAG: JAB domain-containing protein, partial [SAR324 cluster bacterium]|nr:JAB domain-containing protein [SAR324 cluster bacterium]